MSAEGAGGGSPGGSPAAGAPKPQGGASDGPSAGKDGGSPVGKDGGGKSGDNKFADTVSGTRDSGRVSIQGGVSCGGAA